MKLGENATKNIWHYSQKQEMNTLTPSPTPLTHTQARTYLRRSRTCAPLTHSWRNKNADARIKHVAATDSNRWGLNFFMQNLPKNGIKYDTSSFEKSHHGFLDLLVFYWETRPVHKQGYKFFSVLLRSP
jgi:hypothetical protein